MVPEATNTKIKSKQMVGEEENATNLVCSYKIHCGESKKQARS